MRKIKVAGLVQQFDYLSANWTSMMTLFQQTVTTTGDMGTIMNLEQHSFNKVFDKSVLAEINAISNYIGCYKDTPQRDLNGTSTKSGKMTPGQCLFYCKENDYEYAGLQDESYCFCGDSYGRYGKLQQDSCDTPCSGNSELQCGGVWANTIFQTKNVLPNMMKVSKTYQGENPILIVPTVRTHLKKGEALTLNAMVYAKSTPSAPMLHITKIGESNYVTIPFEAVSSGRFV
eukprot:CAMPEP_0168528288 /NCGR_PEP_ID=MMETSP0405-20121227/13160_1 /TAXON_ID=498012 /ORGANISM="Trichosphaerium sp, Strain Am-I-7 wt" /LENGTH=230 /DNA_ID=CAMNT_0008551665 /DNA_START=240 /DNA_END=929 /DNA_ORIENTATION=+